MRWIPRDGLKLGRQNSKFGGQCRGLSFGLIMHWTGLLPFERQETEGLGVTADAVVRSAPGIVAAARRRFFSPKSDSTQRHSRKMSGAD
jgi:hypothetical protein